MRNECRCTNPDGGGAKCPTQHLAICIRGKDKECYGECVPIPNNYSSRSDRFYNWLDDEITNSVLDYTQVNYRDYVTDTPLIKLIKSSEVEHPRGGRMVYRIGNINVYVQFVYEFENDIEPLGGLLQSYIE